MDKKNLVSSTKPITFVETTTLVAISRAKLAPFSSKKPAVIHTANIRQIVLSGRSSTCFRIDSHIIENKLKLLPNFFKALPATSVMLEVKERSAVTRITPIRTDSRIVIGKHQLPLLPGRNITKKVSFADKSTSFATASNEIKQTSLLSESKAETTSNDERCTARPKIHFLYPFRLVWLHSNDLKSCVDYTDSIRLLQQVVHSIDLFKNSQECIDFLKEKTDDAIFLIVSNYPDQSTIRQIHDMPQLDSVFIFSKTMSKRERWTKNWSKIKGIFTDINKMSRRLEQEAQQSRRDSNTISITSIDLNRLDPSFMYTQLLKEVLLEMEDDNKAKKELIEFCRTSNIGSSDRIKVVDEFEQHYHKRTPIWWYSRDCFISNMINRALRLQEVNVIIQTRFFIRDLHKQIEQLYKPPSDKFTLYRGQGLSSGDFEQLRTMKGGLYSFHCFLSTSIDRDVALAFALSSRDDPNLIGIVFHINIDPLSLKSALFAFVDCDSKFPDSEKEILFTMHTVFRVGETKQLEDQLYQIELSLTSDDDRDLKKVSENMREATQGSTGWHRLGKLLLKMEKFDKAEEVLEGVINNLSENDLEGRGHHYHLRGSVKEKKSEYEQALIFYFKSLEIYLSALDTNHLHLITIYNNIGSIYHHRKEYSKALEFHQKALDIQTKPIPLNHSDLVITYSNLAEVHKNMVHYPEALQFYQKTLNIYKKSIPFRYSDLAVTYENIAEMHYNMEETPRSLKLFQKVSKIRQYRLPRNNTEIAISYRNIGKVYEGMKKYSEAAEHYEKARDFLHKCYPQNRSELATICNKIAQSYEKIEKPLKALEFYQETLRYLDRSSNFQGTNLATTHYNIGQMCEKIGEHEKAFFAYRQAILSELQASPQNNSQLHLYQKHFTGVVQGKFK